MPHVIMKIILASSPPLKWSWRPQGSVEHTLRTTDLALLSVSYAPGTSL